MKITLKNSQTDSSYDLEYEEFKTRIQNGELEPTVLIKDKVMSDNEWLSLDNLGMFHKLSPKQYPKGNLLLEKEEQKQQRDLQSKELLKKFKEYSNKDNLEKILKQKALPSLMGSNIQGIARFICSPSFHPESITTFIYTATNVKVQYAQGKTSLWDSIPQLTTSVGEDGLYKETLTTLFDSESIIFEELELPFCDAPYRNWAELFSIAQKLMTVHSWH